MATTMEQLEERLNRLEREVEGLQLAPSPENGHARVHGKPWWRQTAGIFANDELFDEAVRLGAEYRRQQREP